MGAAAQGAEEGEIRPLTIMLGESMRKRCVPGSEAAWGALRRTEVGLTGEMDAFKGRNAGMGVMEVDARDALGGWGGALRGAVAQGAEEE